MSDKSKTAPAELAGLTRVYVCSTFPDMEAEREHLHSVIFPRLEEFCAARGARFEAVDLRWGIPDEEAAEAALLPACFEEIDRCRPFFIALLGQRYGRVPESLREDVASQLRGIFPQLPSGWSIAEMEIRYAVIYPSKSAEHALFYYRDPAVTEAMDEWTRYRFCEPAGSQTEQRLLALKQAIEREGFEPHGYDADWDADSGRLTGLETFGEKVYGDLCAAIEKGASATRDLATAEMPAPLTEPGRDVFMAEEPAEEASPLTDENVQFSVYRPRAVPPEKWQTMLAFAHLSERPPDAPQDEPDPLEEVQRQVRQVLGEEAAEYQGVTQDSQAAVPREGELTFVPEIEGVEFNPPRRTFLWVESVHREEFRFRASAEMDGRTARGRLTVLLGSIVLADISLAVRVDSGARVSAEKAPMESASASPYRRIFASYSHRDTHIVEECERMARIFGDRYLRDCVDLNAGEVWSEKLERLIEEADIFQLFWSTNSMRSPFVRQEWEHALSLGRPHFVRPTYWEWPLPEDPEQELPPEQLRRFHFQYLGVGVGAHAPATVEPDAAAEEEGRTGGSIRSMTPAEGRGVERGTALTMPREEDTEAGIAGASHESEGSVSGASHESGMPGEMPEAPEPGAPEGAMADLAPGESSPFDGAMYEAEPADDEDTGYLLLDDLETSDSVETVRGPGRISGASYEEEYVGPVEVLDEESAAPELQMELPVPSFGGGMPAGRRSPWWRIVLAVLVAAGVVAVVALASYLLLKLVGG